MIQLNVGDIWKFKDQNDYLLHILKIDDKIIHIAIMDDEEYYIVEHMPFDIEIIRTNILKKVGNNKNLPDYYDGYNYWEKEYNDGKAGIYAINIAEALKM